MRCAECGYQNDENTKICIKCGTKLSTSAQSQRGASSPSENASSGNSGGSSPTVKGTPSNQPAWDPGGQKKSEDNFNRCPSCGHYPLQHPVSAVNPCPNCQTTGSNAEGGSSFSSAKTAKLEEVNFGEQSQEVTLTEIRSDTTVELSGNNITVSRENLDPGNDSISSSHAEMTFRNGTLFIKDTSSNQATFLQVQGETAIPKGSKIIIGNKIYRVDY